MEFKNERDAVPLAALKNVIFVALGKLNKIEKILRKFKNQHFGRPEGQNIKSNLSFQI